MPVTAGSLSIVVPCRNEARTIRAFLDSLLAQDLDGFDWEVIIADGMSDDGTRDILRQYSQRDARIRVIDNPRKIASTALNAGIEAARGQLVLRMDAHTQYAPDYVRQCVAVIAETGADNVGGAARTTASGLRQRAIAAAYHSPYSTGGARFHNESYDGPVDTVTYGCWPRNTLLSLGLFDEELVRNQDDELNLRIIRAGGKIWQSSRIRSWYQPRNSLAALFRQYFQYGFWKVAVIRKHRIPASWRHLAPGAFVLANLALPLGAVLAGVLGATSLARLLGWGWILEAAAYALLLVSASIATAAKRGWDLLPLLPAVFAVYHFSYGLGFVAGLAHFLSPRSARPGPGKLFTEVTR
jgi:glycosyltransferase involved in cell wall biosynthesis